MHDVIRSMASKPTTARKAGKTTQLHGKGITNFILLESESASDYRKLFDTEIHGYVNGVQKDNRNDFQASQHSLIF